MTSLESKKKLWGLFDLFPQAVAVSDMKMVRFIGVNNKFCELTQYTREELLGGTITGFGLYSEQDRKRFIHELNISGGIKGLKKDFKTKDHSLVSTLMFAGLITDGREKYVLSIFFDVTERRKAEVLARQAEKNEAITTLAGGIAHEFNNALAVISGNIELLEMELTDNEDVKKFGEAMRASVQRMTKITGQLVSYARGGKYQAKIISIGDLIADILPVLERTLAPSIRIDADLLKDILLVKADCSQIQMILSGILINASEALDGGGEIRISTREEQVDEEFIKTKIALKPGRYVCLAIEDHGKGMDEETKKRIFEPFFSTKFHGRGLGMAASYGIVKNHGGGIYVDSKLGKGTKINIYLPVIDAGFNDVKKTIDKMAVGNGTILVVEDEETVLDVSRAMLEKLGYRVLEARTGKEAIEMAEASNVHIDLALLDIKLPDMEGSDIYPHLKKARPNLKVIICSGLDIHGPALKILEAGAEGFIQKPFTFETLSEKLRELIERRKNNRFKAVSGAVAIPGKDYEKQGQIIDISRGGLAFCYDESEDLTKEFAEFAISLAVEDFYLDKIPCKVTSYRVASDIIPFNPEYMKRVGVRLGGLTQKQTDQLEYFIRNHTTEQV